MLGLKSFVLCHYIYIYIYIYTPRHTLFDYLDSVPYADLKSQALSRQDKVAGRWCRSIG